MNNPAFQSLVEVEAHLQAGRLAEAEELCRRTVEAAPNEAEAHRFLGVIEYLSGRAGEAERILQRAIVLNPANAEAYDNLSLVLKAQGRFVEAETACRKALALKPDYAEAAVNLATVLDAQQRFVEAEETLKGVLVSHPKLAVAEYNLGNVLWAQGRVQEAIATYERALAIRPDYAEAAASLEAIRKIKCEVSPELARAEAHIRAGRFFEARELCRSIVQARPREHRAWFLLAVAAHGSGDSANCLENLHQAIAIEPEIAEYHNFLSLCLDEMGRFVEAEAAARQAIVLRPNYSEALYNLGVTLVSQGRTAEAVEAYQQSLSVAPQFVHAAHNLCTALGQLGRLTEAERVIRHALTLPQPSHEIHAIVENSLGTTLMQQGRMEEAAAAYRRALAIAPDFSVTHSNFLLCLHNLPETDLASLALAHAEWDKRHAQPLQTTWRPHSNKRDPDQPLRLGFVSTDLGQHPVGFFLVRVLESLDKGKAMTVCYSSRPRHDALTERIAAAAGEWREVRGLSDAALAEQVRADQIDVLVDLGGHTSGNRLLVFARKPAPVQITWLGYVGTTGLAAMDYLLADQFHVRPGEEEYYSEQVLRMPNGYTCYGPPEDAPQVGPLPALGVRQSSALSRGASDGTRSVPTTLGITFGCFNNPAKYAPSIVDAWAEILRQVPGAQLLLKYGGLDGPQVQERLRRELARRGVEAGRIVLEGWSPHRELLAAYNRVDLALDTQPYSGGLTTCEALWMGVPVITYPGKTFAGRHSVSHLTNAGYPQFIGADIAGYVELAVQWATRLDELAVIRSQLRDQVRSSPLCDAPRFARELLTLLLAAWESRVAAK